MSETFAASKTSFAQLKSAWRNADEDTRWAFGFWSAGLTMMGAAIVVQFGWAGTLFCFGVVIYAAGMQGFKRGTQDE